MAIRKFEDIVVWQKSQDIAVKIYGHFPNAPDFGFRDQITRASVSISNNIAEGFERNSNPDFKRFLYFAVASNSEVKSMLYLSKRLNFLNNKEANSLIQDSNEITKMLYGLIKSMK